MTTPNLFYISPYLYNQTIPTLTARRQIVKLSGGNRGIAKVLINGALNARRAELRAGGMLEASRLTHENEKARYEKWQRMLGNVPVAQRPIRNNALQRMISESTLNRYFKINQQLYNRIKTHTHTKSNSRQGWAANPRLPTGQAVFRRQKQLFRAGVTYAKLAATVRSARSAYGALIRSAPGTRARTAAERNFEARVARAHTMISRLYN